MKLIAIIPARCGSKGVPFKNIYPINGKPLIAYTIETLKNSIVNEIYVSTDCEKIANIALNLGSKIINRPKEISGDSSPTIDCIKHAIDFLKLNEDDNILLVQPTSPLLKSNDITRAVDNFILDSYETIISVVENHNILWEEKNFYLIPKNHDIKKRIRRQDMNKTFAETGGFYLFKAKNIIIHNNIYGTGKIGYIEIPKSRSFEIDDYEDIKIVEALINV